MKKRNVSIVALLTSLVLLLTLFSTIGYATEKTSNADINIGFAGMTLNNEFHITLANGAKVEAQKLGVNIDIQAGGQHASAADQLAIIENFISNNVDGIIIVPSAPEGLETALKQCKEKGIPVVNADTMIDQATIEKLGMTVPFYGTDNYVGAKLAGEYVAQNYKEPVKTAILTGIEGHKNAADRRNGFVDGAGDKIVIVAEQTANWEVDQGETATQNIIAANPDLQLIFASNDGMAIGALRAVESAGLTDQIKIIGFDAISEAVNLVKEGKLLATVAQFPAKMGMFSVENLVKMIKNEGFETYINTGTEIITKENATAFAEYVMQFANSK